MKVRRTLDSCSLHRTLFEGFSRADDKIGDKADRGSRAGILRFVRFFHSSFEPLDDTVVRRRIGFVLVVSSDVPYAKLTVATVEMRPTMNYHARFRCTNGRHQQRYKKR